MTSSVGEEIPPRPRVFKDGELWVVESGDLEAVSPTWARAMILADEFADRRRDVLGRFLERGKRFPSRT